MPILSRTCPRCSTLGTKVTGEATRQYPEPAASASVAWIRDGVEQQGHVYRLVCPEATCGLVWEELEK